MLEVNIINAKWYSILKSPKKFISQIMNIAMQELRIIQYQCNISIALADDQFLRALNFKFRGNDNPTNVLSFPHQTLSHKCDLGDIAISIDTIQKESSKFFIPIIYHIEHMLLHGLLHLLGYSHEQEDKAEIMKNLENQILTLLM
ncbi:rRNA maturation RNase YbeY [Wolbachia endosymbiont of Howardula sp.]|uniref:rRNA maturation RNase YbeY n=1 Tax=Wolbachia endosymbiont of Howardula sp. TaxID=2916816 RepID=UPI00217E9211|nr:rRNA maturation RNase YbeY [Wolbachia endosymbiont of Howardula sp.]UWI83380.1 rRNA maturation RNase YbeY [Wolbachia endosymbiont of Howardula sp.]